MDYINCFRDNPNKTFVPPMNVFVGRVAGNFEIPLPLPLPLPLPVKPSIQHEHKDIETSIQHEQCSICMNNKKCISLSCGHVYSCMSCSPKIGEKCGLCRSPVLEKRIVFI